MGSDELSIAECFKLDKTGFYIDKLATRGQTAQSGARRERRTKKKTEKRQKTLPKHPNTTGAVRKLPR
jgi:hypothetical protein